MNRKKMIQATIGIMGLVTSFLPQQVLADYCKIDCPPYGSCSVSGDNISCACDPWPICISWSNG